MNNYRTGIRVTLAILVAILAGTAFGVMMERSSGRSGKVYVMPRPQSDKLSWLLSLIQKRYVDHISRDSLAEFAIPAILKELDPHSVYIPAQEFAATNESLMGTFDGIGVMFNMLTDTVLVSTVISGGPSDRAGLVAGDRIVTVNDSVIAGVKMDQDEVVKMLRGERGSKVTLGILRAPAKELFPVTVTRGAIPIKSLDASFMARPGVGYIKFSRFAATTYEEVGLALMKLQGQGARKVILDLRGNAGGYLDQAIRISNEFLPAGQKIVYTEGDSSPREIQEANGRGLFQDIELAVVIDEFSASASEIVAGAMQDNDRAVIVGRRSFGKGLVQEQFGYPDGSAVRITISRYYTPVGRSIQKPYTPGDEDDYNLEVLRRFEHQEMFTADSIRFDDSLRYVTPGGKVVYGGGGIMPDIFVPRDTNRYTSYYIRLFQKNLPFRYSMQFADQHRAELNAVRTFEELDRLLGRRNLYYDFIAYAERQGVRPTQTEMTLSRELIVADLKGYIGRNTPLEENALYYYLFPTDNALMRAVEALDGAAAADDVD